MNNMNMVCKLCLEDKQLARESHIIPQLMYRQLLLDDGFFYKLNSENLKKFSDGKTIKGFINGEYDSDILCLDCENMILCNRYEDYAAKVYDLISTDLESYDGIEIENITNVNGVHGKRLKNIDYSRFKLFLLSILWRASISSRGFFDQVSVGIKHHEIIRNMIYNCDPKDIQDYPCFICDLSKDEPTLK
ncbi:MAG: hypothetical protein ACREOP_09100, partial [Thermodesulfobacteriota bacterium]